MDPQLVILVHGVNPDREWPLRTRRMLEPHFRCEVIEYHEYDTILGPIRAVIPVSALFIVLATLIAAVVSLFWFSWLTTLTIFLACIVCLVSGLLIARHRRHSVLRHKYQKQFEKYRGFHAEAPHVIAHSLGTWLTAKAMELHPTAVFDRVIFVGSVVPRRFAWKQLRETTKPDAFSHLRNEVGKSDWVVLLAGLVPFRLTEMGFGGIFGFAPSDLLHRQIAPRGPCLQCGAGSIVPIHNVPLRTYRHSDVFLGSTHAAELWLPDLWGYPPAELHRFHKLCQAMVRFVKASYSLGIGEAERQLRSTNWSWTSAPNSPRSLERFLEDRVVAYATKANNGVPLSVGQLEMVQDAVARAVLGLCETISDAIRACDPQFAPDLEAARRLYPPIAMHVALLAALEKTPWKLPAPSIGTKS